MSEVAQKRTAGWLARVCGLAMLVALIVVPVCQPLCAARICSQLSAPSAEKASCHSGGATHGDTCQVHAVQNCGAPELPVAVLTSPIQDEVLQVNHASVLSDGYGVLPQEISSPRLQQCKYCVGDPPTSRFFGSSLFNGVLRI